MLTELRDRREARPPTCSLYFRSGFVAPGRPVVAITIGANFAPAKLTIMPSTSRKMLRVGYWMSDKKIRKLNFTAYCDCLRREQGIEMILLALDEPLEAQGPFDLILHKLTDVMAAADAGDERSVAAVRRAEMYFQAHPSLRLVDPLSAVRNLTDRDTCYSLMKACSKNVQGVEIGSPNFVTINESTEDKVEALRSCNVSFPIVCKSIVAHGSDLAHKMAIIFNEEHLCDMQTPCVAQQFVNHSAVLHKVFVIGESHYIVERPSIKDLVAGDHETIFFDSHDVSKATSDSYLNQMEEKSGGLPKPNADAIAWLVKQFRETMSLNLFGVDLIIENDTNRHIFIDVNYFPGYDGVPDMFPAFSRLLNSLLTASPSATEVRPSVESPGDLTSSSCSSSLPCHSGVRDNGVATVFGSAMNGDVSRVNGFHGRSVENGASLHSSSSVDHNGSESSPSHSSMAASSGKNGLTNGTNGSSVLGLLQRECSHAAVNGQRDDACEPVKAKRSCDYEPKVVDAACSLTSANSHSTLPVLS